MHLGCGKGKAMQAETTYGVTRPTMEQAKAMLTARGWRVGGGCWEDDDKVFAFAAESTPSAMGGAAACVHWRRLHDGRTYLSVPASKRSDVQYC